MTKEEIYEWLKNAKVVDYIKHYNLEGDGYEYAIYEKDGKFYHLDMRSHGIPWELTKNDYVEPYEVKKLTRTVEETYYE